MIYSIASIVVCATATTFTAVTPAMAAPSLASTDAPTGKEVFSWQDPAIKESSGLAIRGEQMFTINDSGHRPIVYAASRDDGRTMASITFAPRKKSVRDAEALSFDGNGDLWIGDIGDNYSKYGTYALWHLKNPAKTGTVKQMATRHRFQYADGEGRDAEALLIHPTTGVKYVVTKGIFGGGAYQLPASWPAADVATAKLVASTHGLVTDGAFTPDGKYVLLRTYGVLTVHKYPSFKLVRTYRLPSQQQGEGMAVDADGKVYLSTEGVNTPVLHVQLPDNLTAPTTPPAPSQPGAAPTSPPAPLTPTSAPTVANWDVNAVWQQLPQAMQNKFVLVGAAATAVVAAVGTGGFVWWLRRRNRRRGKH